MAFEREKTNVSADDLLKAIASGSLISLTQCTVIGPLDINRLFDPDEGFATDELNLSRKEELRNIVFSEPIAFDKCTFEDNVVFSAPWAQPDTVTVEFEKDIIFNSSVFKGQARFRSAVFHDIAGFDGCTFEGVVNFKNAWFKGDAKFRTAIFHGYCLLGNAVFESSARFTNTHFAKGADFSSVRFVGNSDFSGVYSSSRSVPNHQGVTFDRQRYGNDESFWRFVKQSAHEAGHYGMSGEAFYRERSAGLRQRILGFDFPRLSRWQRTRRLIRAARLLPEIFLVKLLFGYGERPVRVLIAGVMVILACAFFYCQPGALKYAGQPVEPSFPQSLYFSTITFTTLGYGDLYPADMGLIRSVAMVEAVAGLCLMSLFVVCLAKRFSRG